VKAPALLIALGKRRGMENDEEEAPPSSQEGSYSREEKDAMAGDLLDAIESKDKTAVYDAIETIVMACGE
jgi:hypothetical protein